MKFAAITSMLLLGISCSSRIASPEKPPVSTTEATPTETPGESPSSPTRPEELPESESVCSQFYIRPESLKIMPELTIVARKAECVLKNALFHAAIHVHGKFAYSEKSTDQIVDDIKKCDHAMLRTYYKRFGSVVAFRNVGENDIYFNTKFAGNSIADKVNTAIHELLHIKGYSHPFNQTADRNESVPYMIGTIAQKFADSCNE